MSLLPDDLSARTVQPQQQPQPQRAGAALPELHPAERLAAAFAAQAVGWARAAGASPASQHALRRAAAAVSRATSEGHVCVPLAALLAEAPATEDDAEAAFSSVHALRSALLASGVVGVAAAGRAPQPACPLLLDSSDRLYLHRHFEHEQALAARLLQAAQAPAQALSLDTQTWLQRLFQPNEAALQGAPDWQKLAAALALRGRLTLISGGPGTGKTTTVVNLLACVLAQQPGCRIALAAPTGKAAARMTEAIRQRAAHLPVHLQALLPTEASTVHRLLGVNPAAGAGGERFLHHARHPLAIDLLVVDEASMLDLALARRLLDAVPAAARIVLLGDKDQLAAVEAGAVFAELSARPGLDAATRAALAPLCGLPAEALLEPEARSEGPQQAAPGPLGPCVLWLRRSFRFGADSGIGRLASGIRHGQTAATLDGLRHSADASVRWLDRPVDSDTALATLLRDGLGDALQTYLATLQQALPDPAIVSAAFNRFRVLCALREGPRGVHAVNQHLSQWTCAALGLPAHEVAGPWFPGRPVMVLRNDPLLQLFNGDIGLALPDAQGQMGVYFPVANGSGYRRVPTVRLPEHQTAYAMTVHKAQGSEFDSVLLLLPAQRSPVLTRELLYTAVTRARQRLVLAGSAEVLAAAIALPTQRHSGLLARLQEQAQELTQEHTQERAGA